MDNKLVVMNNIRDIDVLAIMCEYSHYNQYKQYLNTETLSKEAYTLLVDFGVYYEVYKTDRVCFTDFQTFFFHLRHPEMNKDEKDNYCLLFANLESRIKQPVSISSKLLIEEYRKQEYLVKIHANKNPEEIQELTKQYLQKEALISNKTEFIINDLEEVLKQTDQEAGYSWRLNELNPMLGALSPGVFGIIAARVNSGKSSFLVSEMSYVMQQGAKILWFNNENMGIRVIPRLYSATLNMRRDELIKDYKNNQECYKTLGGDNIYLLDIQNKDYKYIEKVVKEQQPNIVVIDMMDNVVGFTPSKSDLSTYKHEKLYQWALELACTYKCTVLGTSQIPAIPEKWGKPDEFLAKYPTLGMLAGSRGHAKQGAASWILMIGRDAYPTDITQDIRYLSSPKSKFGTDRLKYEVCFDEERSLFWSPRSPYRKFNV